MTTTDPPPVHVAGHAVWWSGDEATAVAFVGRGPAGDRPEILARVLGRRLPVAWVRQVHGDHLVEAVAGQAGEADALTTDAAELALAISTADCVPLVLASADRLVAAHAGWRGIVADVVGRAMAALEGAPASAWIGPAIGPCCYEVGDEVATAVAAVAGSACVVDPPAGGRPRLDLTTAVEARLGAGGISRVTTVGACTRCRSELHSYRRDGEAAGRNLAFAWRRGGA